MTDTYGGLPETVQCLTPDCGEGGVYPGEEFENVRLVWLEGGKGEPSMPCLQADCPNPQCNQGQIEYDYTLADGQDLVGWDECPDCEGKEWVALDLELVHSEDRAGRPEWEIYESVKGDIGL